MAASSLAPADTPNRPASWRSGSGDVPQGQLITRLRGHGSSINSLAFTPDGALLVSASGARRSAVFGGDNTVRVWDADLASPTFGAELARSESLTGWARGFDDQR